MEPMKTTTMATTRFDVDGIYYEDFVNAEAGLYLPFVFPHIGIFPPILHCSPSRRFSLWYTFRPGGGDVEYAFPTVAVSDCWFERWMLLPPCLVRIATDHAVHDIDNSYVMTFRIVHVLD